MVLFVVAGNLLSLNIFLTDSIRPAYHILKASICYHGHVTIMFTVSNFHLTTLILYFRSYSPDNQIGLTIEQLDFSVDTFHWIFLHTRFLVKMKLQKKESSAGDPGYGHLTAKLLSLINVGSSATAWVFFGNFPKIMLCFENVS